MRFAAVHQAVAGKPRVAAQDDARVRPAVANARDERGQDVDRLVERGASLYEPAERKAVYRELDALILDEAWFVSLVYGTYNAAAPLKVHNLDRLMASDAKMDLRRIWMSE